jgi:hypothetical protein
VFTPNFDPFPTASTVTISGGFNTPFGYVSTISLSGFALQNTAVSGADYTYTYNANFHNDFHASNVDPTVQGQFNGTSSNFVVEILGRGGAGNVGTFTANLLSATFSGVVTDLMNTSVGNLATSLQPGQSQAGTAVFTGPVVVGGNIGEYADTSFVINPQYAVNGGAPVTLPPLTANSTPPDVTGLPVPAPLALMVPGLLAMFAGRRRAAVAA